MSYPKIISIPRDDVRCRAQLLDFDFVNGDMRFRAIPREVLGFDVIFELKPERGFGGVGNFATWFRSLRAFSLTATFLPCMATILYLQLAGIYINWPLAILATLAAVLLQMAVNLLNDYEDYLKLIDLPGSLGGSGVLTQGLIKAKTLKKVALGFLFLGVLCGLPALWTHPLPILTVGMLGVLGVLGYSGKPLRLKYVAWGDFSVFLLVGPLLTVGVSVAATGWWTVSTLLLGAAFGFAAAAILHANNMQDIFVDTRRGAITLASKLGFKASRYLLLGYYACVYASLVTGFVLGVMGWEVFVCLGLTLGLCVGVVRRAFLASGPLSPQLGLIRILSAQTHLSIGLALIVGLVARMFFMTIR